MATASDPKRPNKVTTVRDFLGFAPNLDPHKLPPGVALKQVNAVSWKPGELRVRPGYAVVQFDTPQ